MSAFSLFIDEQWRYCEIEEQQKLTDHIKRRNILHASSNICQTSYLLHTYSIMFGGLLSFQRQCQKKYLRYFFDYFILMKGPRKVKKHRLIKFHCFLLYGTNLLKIANCATNLNQTLQFMNSFSQLRVEIPSPNIWQVSRINLEFNFAHYLLNRFSYLGKNADHLQNQSLRVCCIEIGSSISQQR